MTFPDFTKIFVIGGTGAQGIPVLRSLVRDGKYHVRVLTRAPSSPRAQAILALSPNVELLEGTFTNEEDLRKGYAGCDAAFVNIDGFTTGEKSELYWAIRTYELAVADGGIRFFVYGNLEYVSKLAGYKPEFRTGHYDGKGRVGEWILFQAGLAAKTNSNAMGAALFTTGPYIEMAISKFTLMSPTIEKNDKGEDAVTWKLPQGEGAIAHVSLDDCGTYVRWLFDNSDRSNGMDLGVAIDHIRYEDVAQAFTKVTGKPAQFVNVSLETYWKESPLSSRADYPAGYSADPNDPATMTMRDNFTGFWNIWQNSGGNTGLIRRNYALLDEIHPKRIRSVEEFFRLEEEKGRKEGLGSLWERVQPDALKSILKLHDDGFQDPSKSH